MSLKILVTGGTGFVGRYVVNTLERRGHAVRLLARDAARARSRFLRPPEVVVGDVLQKETIVPAARGCDAVVHLVGIIFEPHGGPTFDEAHRQATVNVLEAAQAAGVSRHLQMSAMGASPEGPSKYARTKAAGEEAVRGSALDWTIFRPSLIFGPGDGFFTMIARLVSSSLLAPGFIPVIGRGETRFLPVSVRDVARCFAEALEKPDQTRKKTFEVGGSETFTLNQLYREVARLRGQGGKRLVHLPVWWGRLIALASEIGYRARLLPRPLLTLDQLRSLAVDNVADTSQTVEVFGQAWISLHQGLREYLERGPHDERHGIGHEIGEPPPLLRVR
jgi:uncharacterized protein YbjT (DUF2867 family)